MREIKKVFAYAKDYKNKVYASIILAILGVFFGMIPYYLVYNIIMRFIGDVSTTVSYILIISVLILICLVAKSFMYFKALTASHEATYDTLMGMRVKMADKMIKMQMGEINKKSAGEFKNIFVDIIEDMEVALAHMIPEGISNIVVPVAVVGYLFVLDFRMALLSLANIPIAMIMYSLMMRGFEKKMALQIKSSREMNANVIEYINGMEVIKIFNQTTSSFKKYTNSVKGYKKFVLGWYKESWKYMSAVSVIVPCTVLFVLPFGALFYIQGTLTLSTYILCMLLSMGLGTPLNKLTEFVRVFKVIMEKSKVIDKVFNNEELVESNNSSIPKSRNITFNNVTFAYDEKDVLKDVNFQAEENTVTALVGTSGSGKSTIAKLIVRFWDVKSGEIKIGDVNIKEISFENLMNLISYVSQDIYLFNTSIMENIRTGRPDASDEEVINVSKLAQCHDFIMKLENGYDTSVGDTGNKLSGGQKQRISIARALIKDAPIIILDEATAFTDPENEEKIQDALNGLIDGKTLIVIAHRLSTIVDSNNIILMDNGEISAQGTHDELLLKSDIYHSMWDANTQAMEWDISVKEGVYNA
ncbi:ABC transporter ATP-binding protein [Vallitalea sediminicola]